MIENRVFPGTEFYFENLTRARALPEAERSADVAALLSHDAMDAAAPAIPSMPTDGTVLTEPLGGDAALAALLQFLAHSFACPPADPLHSHATLRHYGTQLPPLFRTWAQGSQVQMAAQPLLHALLTSRRLPPG